LLGLQFNTARVLIPIEMAVAVTLESADAAVATADPGLAPATESASLEDAEDVGLDKSVNPSSYRFQGQRYSTEGAFIEAAKGNFRASVQDANDDDKLLEIARKLFLEFAKEHDDGTTKLKLPEMAGLVKSVAAEVGMNPKDIGSPAFLFYRYDFGGDDALDEEEAMQMVAAMLRHHKEKMSPPKPGQPKLMSLPFKNLEEVFVLGKKVGQGGQGSVYLAMDKATKIERVVKMFTKANANAPIGDIKDEFRLLKTLDHPKIQRIYDIFEDRANVYMISEPYNGGDLESLVPRATAAGVRVTNRWLGRILLQVVQGVAYLHSRHVMHCDLKEPNAMITNRDQMDEPSIVVIDFGLADMMTTKKRRCAGTPGYIPPEVWTNELWTPKGDVFCLGVMIYQMFAGERCFQGSTIAGVRNKTLHGKPDMECVNKYTNLPSLVTAMLNKSFKHRPTCAKVLEEPFFNGLTDCQEQDVPEDVIKSLCRVGRKSEVGSAILADIADMQNLSQLKEINQAFTAMDTDNSGIITEAEARAKLSGSLPAEKVEGVINALLGDDGKIAYTEFCGQMLFMAEADMDQVLWREFEMLDKNGSGYLCEEEVAALLQRPALASLLGGQKLVAANLMQLMDKDSNGQISFEEFLATLHGDRDSNANVAAAGPAATAGAPTGQKIAVAEAPAGIETRLVETQKPAQVCEPEVAVTWKNNKMTMYGTRAMMEDSSFKNVMIDCFGTSVCCWWMPLVFFLAAANVTDAGCEVGLDIWLRLCGIFLFAAIPGCHCVYYVFGRCKAPMCFKISRKVMWTAPLIFIGYSFSGFGIYAVVSEDKCLKTNWSGVQPITLVLAWAIIGSVLGCWMIFCGLYARSIVNAQVAPA